MRGYVAVVLGVILAQGQTQVPDSQEYPPPGRLVDIGGRKLHLDCSGKGSPTVVLVAGGNAFSIDWALVQPRVAICDHRESVPTIGPGWRGAIRDPPMRPSSRPSLICTRS